MRMLYGVEHGSGTAPLTVPPLWHCPPVKWPTEQFLIVGSTANVYGKLVFVMCNPAYESILFHGEKESCVSG